MFIAQSLLNPLTYRPLVNVGKDDAGNEYADVLWTGSRVVRWYKWRSVAAADIPSYESRRCRRLVDDYRKRRELGLPVRPV